MLEPRIQFPATRQAGLERLHSFLPDAGTVYAAKRNYDFGPGKGGAVSRLSPYIRARLITEAELIRAVLNSHDPAAAEKFIQEIFWRTYWKGWLEMRPSVWSQYQTALLVRMNEIQTQSGLRHRWERACKGETGIDCFDAWANELVNTGYLHNHARMWFASIWIFTLELPWELGADFFLRHLLDGDPASNTLGWRWVAGLQTPGKTYLALPDNIAKFTDGRFSGQTGLAKEAIQKTAPPLPDRQPLPDPEWMDPGLRTGLLLHDDDLAPLFLLDAGLVPVTTAFIQTRAALSPLHVAPHVMEYAKAAGRDTSERLSGQLGPVVGCQKVEDIVAWSKLHDLEQIVTPYAPVGPNADMLRVLALTPGTPSVRRITRRYDRNAWPHATAGFFRFKERIPRLLDQLQNAPLSE